MHLLTKAGQHACCQRPEKCAEKFGEEAVEAIIEAAKGNKTGLIKESADVIFHLFVLLRSQDITLSEVLDELTSRQFQSGLAEKAARSVKNKPLDLNAILCFILLRKEKF